MEDGEDQEKSDAEHSDAGSQPVDSDYDVDEEYDNDYADNYFDNGEADDNDDLGGGPGGDEGGGMWRQRVRSACLFDFDVQVLGCILARDSAGAYSNTLEESGLAHRLHRFCQPRLTALPPIGQLHYLKSASHVFSCV